MSYDRSSPEDSALHVRHHDRVLKGVEWPMTTSAALSKAGSVVGTIGLGREKVVKALGRGIVDGAMRGQGVAGVSGAAGGGASPSVGFDLDTVFSSTSVAKTAVGGDKIPVQLVRYVLPDSLGTSLSAASSTGRSGSGNGSGEIFLHRKLGEVLETIDTALGAASLFPRAQYHDDQGNDTASPALKLFLAVCAGRVLGGAVVATRIEEGKARDVLEDDDADVAECKVPRSSDGLRLSSSPLSASQTPPLGVHRIYVVPSLRRCGLARSLLDTVVEHSLYGVGAKQLREDLRSRANDEGSNGEKGVPLLAFSQPTESGARLARAWLEAQRGQAGENRLVVFEE